MVNKVALELQYRILGSAANMCGSLVREVPRVLESSGVEAQKILQEFHYSYCENNVEVETYAEYSVHEGLEVFGNPEIGGVPLRGENLRGYRSSFMDELRSRRGPFDEIRTTGQDELLELIPARVREMEEMFKANAKYQSRLGPWLVRLRERRMLEGLERSYSTFSSAVSVAKDAFQNELRDIDLCTPLHETSNQLVATLKRFGAYNLLLGLHLDRLDVPASTTTGQSGRVSLSCALVRGAHIPISNSLGVDAIPLQYEVLVPDFRLSYRDWWGLDDLASAIRAKVLLLRSLAFFSPAHDSWLAELGSR